MMNKLNMVVVIKSHSIIPDVLPTENMASSKPSIKNVHPVNLANLWLACIHFSIDKLLLSKTSFEVLYRVKHPKKIDKILLVIILLF